MALACLQAVSRCLSAAAADPGGREKLFVSAQTFLLAEPRERADLLAAEAFLDTPDGAFSPGEKCQLQELLRSMAQAKQAGEKDRRRQSQDYTRLHFFLTAEHWARLSGKLSLREKAEYILETAATVLQLGLPTELTLAGVTAVCSLLERAVQFLAARHKLSGQLLAVLTVNFKDLPADLVAAFEGHEPARQTAWPLQDQQIAALAAKVPLRSTNAQAAPPAMSGPAMADVMGAVMRQARTTQQVPSELVRSDVPEPIARHQQELALDTAVGADNGRDGERSNDEPSTSPPAELSASAAADLLGQDRKGMKRPAARQLGSASKPSKVLKRPAAAASCAESADTRQSESLSADTYQSESAQAQYWGHAHIGYYTQKSYIRYWCQADKKYRLIIGASGPNHKAICKQLWPAVKKGKQLDALQKMRARLLKFAAWAKASTDLLHVLDTGTLPAGALVAALPFSLQAVKATRAATKAEASAEAPAMPAAAPAKPFKRRTRGKQQEKEAMAGRKRRLSHEEEENFGRCLSLPGCSDNTARAIWNIAGELREDGAAASRSSAFTTRTDLTADALACYERHELAGESGKPVPILIGVLAKLLRYAARGSPPWATVLDRVFKRDKGRRLSCVLYHDELICGNVLAVRKVKKICMIYLSFRELYASLSKEDAWLTVAAVQASVIDRIAGGMTRLMTAVVKSVHAKSHESGFVLELPSGPTWVRIRP
ncbi:unnamed protein product, partial [Effrenium voratum]